MNLSNALKILGIDHNAYFKKLSESSRKDKIVLVQETLETCKKNGKTLMAMHHPDKGGDVKNFKLINESLSVISMESEAFTLKMEQLIIQQEEKSSGRVLITHK